LIGLVAALYELSKSNKDFLDSRFLRDNQALARYKSQIKQYLTPSSSYGDGAQYISLRDARKVLSDYKKATSDTLGLVDLMIYYLECGTNVLCQFGDMYSQYYRSLESVMESVIKIIKQFDPDEAEGFIKRLRVVVKRADKMGWGYYDNISYMLKHAEPVRLT
jgi:hypothetical protein